MKELDYMSASSGGGYTASWVQAHLGADQHNFYRDADHYEVGASDFDTLTNSRHDHVEHLRTHAGFLNRGGWFEGFKLIGSYVIRLPCSLVLDIALHVKTETRLNNWCHPITIYKKRIESLYFRGDPPSSQKSPPKRDTKLHEINTNSSYSTPYLVLTGSLANGGKPRSGEMKPSQPYNFEFTRHYTGSDGLGYVQTPGLDRPVAKVHLTDQVPTGVTVYTSADPFPLSAASAASGAALDPDGWAPAFFRSPWVHATAAFLLAPLNLNLGYEAPNFARGYDGWSSIIDYFHMVTWQRLSPLVFTDARWIKILDGGHYDNLGILALARRGVSCIVAVDASADPNLKFGDLRQLAQRLESIGLKLKEQVPTGTQAREASYAFTIVRKEEPSTVVSRVLYLKSNADDSADHLQATGDVTVQKIQAFRDRPKDYGRGPYPHTTTLLQWYDWERFEAYRLLGYQMAKTYLVDPKADLDMCEFAKEETTR